MLSYLKREAEEERSSHDIFDCHEYITSSALIIAQLSAELLVQ